MFIHYRHVSGTLDSFHAAVVAGFCNVFRCQPLDEKPVGLDARGKLVHEKTAQLVACRQLLNEKPAELF